uniref:RING-type domain-containing protein n=1 Tax=Oryza punctata TaxID=4537 RepID=A0A0E0M811_ORYPU
MVVVVSHVMALLSSALSGKAAAEGDDDGGQCRCWRDGDGGGGQAAAGCCVCISGFREGEEVRRLPCGHAFHRDCVDRWLALYCRRRTCPLCRLHVGGAVVAAAVAGLDELQLGDDLVIWFSSLFVATYEYEIKCRSLPVLVVEHNGMVAESKVFAMGCAEVRRGEKWRRQKLWQRMIWRQREETDLRIMRDDVFRSMPTMVTSPTVATVPIQAIAATTASRPRATTVTSPTETKVVAGVTAVAVIHPVIGRPGSGGGGSIRRGRRRGMRRRSGIRRGYKCGGGSHLFKNHQRQRRWVLVAVAVTASASRHAKGQQM